MATTNTNRFVFVQKKETFTAELQVQYFNSIVFIKDTNEIFTHGQFFGMSAAMVERIEALEENKANKSWFSGANAIDFNEGVISLILASGESAGNVTLSQSENGLVASVGASTIRDFFSEGAGISISVAGEISINAQNSDSTIITTDGGLKVEVSESWVKGVIDEYFATTDGTDVITYSNGKFTLNTEDTNSITFSVKNGKLTAEANLDNILNGYEVKNVKSGEKVISVDENGGLSSTLKIDYSVGTLYIKGINDEVVSSVDVSDFIKDNFIESGSLSEDGKKLILVLNNNEKSEIEINVEKLIDIYNGANINLTSAYTIPETYTAPTSGDSMDVAIAKLVKKIQDLGTSAYAGVKNGTDGDFITTTISETGEDNKQSIGVAVKTQTIIGATLENDGLATAFDVQQYLAWEEL